MGENSTKQNKTKKGRKEILKVPEAKLISKILKQRKIEIFIGKQTNKNPTIKQTKPTCQSSPKKPKQNPILNNKV